MLRGATLDELLAVVFFDFGDELFDFFGVFGGADEGGFGGVDDDQVVAADGGEEVGGVFADGEDVGGVEVLDFGQGAVVVGVGWEGFAEGGPASDVEPLDGHGDGGDVGGFFHDGEVDRHLGEGGIDGVEDFLLARGVPGVGDLHEATVGFGEVLFELVEDGFGFPDEHAGVPGVLAGGDVLFGDFFLGFFFEGLDFEDAGAVGEFGAALDVAEAGGGEGGGDAEGDEGFGVFVDGVEGAGECGLEDIEGFDDVVGGEDGEGGVRVAFVEDGGGEADGVGGVAAHGFAEELGVGEEGEVVEDLLGVGGAGADVDAGGVDEAAEAGGGESGGGIAADGRVRRGDEAEELFGFAGAGHGPEAGAGAAGHDDCVSHKWLRENESGVHALACFWKDTLKA